MGEVATVAAIVGGIATSGITGMVTWRVSRNTTSVELVKVAAENHRLRHGNQEEERRNRQSTYHQFLDVAAAVYNSLGFPTSKEEIKKLSDTYVHLLSGVVLFGPPSVREGAFALNAIHQKIWPAIEQEEKGNPQKSIPERWADATSDLKPEFGLAISTLVHLMHADVTQGIVNDPRSAPSNGS